MTAALLFDFNGVINDDEPQHRDADLVWPDFVDHPSADPPRSHA